MRKRSALKLLHCSSSGGLICNTLTGTGFFPPDPFPNLLPLLGRADTLVVDWDTLAVSAGSSWKAASSVSFKIVT